MYEKLVESLRNCVADDNGCCFRCPEDCNGPCQENLMKQAADAIEELQAQLMYSNDAAKKIAEKVPKWIPVTERLPDLYEDVQILFPNNQAAGFYDGCGWCTYTGDTWYSMVGEEEVKPTHWAKKLPEPPKEEIT